MAQSNGFISSHGAYDEDDKPMLIIKKSIDSQGNGLTALINKQLQGEMRDEPNRILLSFLCSMLLASECGMTKETKSSLMGKKSSFCPTTIRNISFFL